MRHTENLNNKEAVDKTEKPCGCKPDDQPVENDCNCCIA